MNIKMIGAAVLVGAVVAGCGKKEEEQSKVSAPKTKVTAKATVSDGPVLAVNGVKLMRSALDADAEALIKAQGGQVPAARRDALLKMARENLAKDFIFKEVLRVKAKAEGYVVTDADRKAREDDFRKIFARSTEPDAPKTLDEYFAKFPLGAARAKADFEDGLLIDKMLKDLAAKASKTDYAVKAKEIIAGIVSNNLVSASSVTNALAKIKALKAQLDKVAEKDVAAKFAELAKVESACPSGSRGGDLEEFIHGQMVPEFDKVAFALPVNKVSEPVKTQFGYHLILVTKKVPAVEAKGDKPAEPEKVRASHILIKTGETRPVPKAEDVVKHLKAQAEHTFVRDFILGEVEKAKIEAFDDEIKAMLPKRPEARPTPPTAAPADKKVSAEKKSPPVEKSEKK